VVPLPEAPVVDAAPPEAYVPAEAPIIDEAPIAEPAAPPADLPVVDPALAPPPPERNVTAAIAQVKSIGQ